MSRYLLSCPACQAAIPVGVAQAGASVRCPGCGQSVEVPGTRDLRNLPRESASSGSASSRAERSGGWDRVPFAYRMALASLLLFSCVSLLYGGYLVFLRATAPIEFGHSEEEIYEERFKLAMKDPVIRSWDHFNFLVDSGVPERPEPLTYSILNRYYKEQLPWLIGSLIAGFASLLAFLGLSWFGGRGLARR